jgi:ubiquinone biosynthesis protein COQ4
MNSLCRPCLKKAIGANNLPTAVRAFSVLNRPPPNYDGHVPLTTIERTALAVGSGILAYLNPRRAGTWNHRFVPTSYPQKAQARSIIDNKPPPFLSDLIALFGETTAQPYFANRLRKAMLRSPSGRRILRDRPRLTSTTLSLPHLAALPENTVGRTYHDWLVREKVSPDTRAQVRYIDSEECAYVMQRYRESHDFYHALTGLPTVREGEVALKAFEFTNTGLPMTGLSVLSVFTLKPKERERFWETYGPWAVRNGLCADEVINVYWEEELGTDVDVLRQRLGIEKPPDLRDIRRKERGARKQEEANTQT